MQRGMLLHKQLHRFLVLVKSHHHAAQLGLLFVQVLAI
jgi:hypothetical protein